MWIAKNAKTGTTYGKSYESIYDCQKFIDSNLKLLEYEMQRCFAVEERTISHIKNKGKSLVEIFRNAIKELESANSTKVCKKALEMTLEGKSEREVDAYITKMVMTDWQSNNIIRCYNVEQKRFADGFDF